LTSRLRSKNILDFMHKWPIKKSSLVESSLV
jgi:hypothetical protein